MMRVFRFNSAPEAAAFVRGVEFVNDTSLSVAPTRVIGTKHVVLVRDDDYAEGGLPCAAVTPAIIALRGVDARIEWAKACGIADLPRRLLAKDWAVMQAYLTGSQDYQRGRTDCPPLLRTTLELADAWRLGLLGAHKDEENCDETAGDQEATHKDGDGHA
ncbi:hypothetical protein [Achromobacter ruhlandii]|uniref:hypothetical protein n=1 Tax=Achromobacter ruhlandii TaxID=72557 RepID=UPI003B9F100E